MSQFEEAGREIWIAVRALAILIGLVWVASRGTEEQFLIGLLILFGMVTVPFMLWAIIAPILRWWRRRRTRHHLKELYRVSHKMGLYDDE